ncbi:hypothetical protein Poli38472_010826 [Pythium oligandrum]|uniref:PH domain-containing protein n=1 Tax=Pythium oligandrum TaxID=41045 RepID=A0A8K1CFU1_PYTOL|nr:hypothetical protein Poli38472_010826 [Pythium oligandrum]|eukprot:TMW61763.1 hypothetical protein Poli38472_010826 [Pythium oligandrum]
MQRTSDRHAASTPILPRLYASPSASPSASARDIALLDQTRNERVLLMSRGGDVERENKSSAWIQRYHAVARQDLVQQDITAMLKHFEDLSVPARARKSMNMSTWGKQTVTSAAFAGLDDDEPLVEGAREGSVGVAAGSGVGSARLRRQATSLINQRRAKTLDREFIRQQPVVKVIPSRFLYDSTRWQQSSRCDYCQLAGGDLTCATCNVIAHARCYLAAYESQTKKTKGAFVVPTRFSWLCQHCQTSLQDEYDERSKKARSDHIANQKSVFGKVVKAYVRMTRDATIFRKKKKSIIRIQAIMRGRLARMRFHRMLRMRLKPYAIEGMTLRGLHRVLTAVVDAHTTPTGTSDELRLANGFTCNPYVYVTVVDGEDDDAQLFCYETSIRRGVLVDENEIAWSEKLFVPGVNGNVTFCFTVLSKNGPNNFVLGQAMLRLRDSELAWRTGVDVDLPISADIEIFPRTAQRQPLRLADIHTTVHLQSLRKRTPSQFATDPVFANGSSATLSFSVTIRPFSEVHSHCGYMLTKNTLDSFQTSQRWCVLADGILRIYRHYGVTLATETVDMSRTIEIKLLETTNVHREEQWIAMEHMTRLYIFQCERKAPMKQWLKKLSAAIRYGTSSPPPLTTSHDKNPTQLSVL